MRSHHLAALVLGLSAVPLSQASAVPEQAFGARTTSELVTLCATPPSDPAYAQAQQFCNGFAAGALSYHRAMTRPGSPPQYCRLPDTRAAAVNQFVTWAQAHPELSNANPANALFRFLDTNFRCQG